MQAEVPLDEVLCCVMCRLHHTAAAAAAAGFNSLAPRPTTACLTWCNINRSMFDQPQSSLLQVTELLFCEWRMVHGHKCHRTKPYRRLRLVTYRLRPTPAAAAGFDLSALPPRIPKAITCRQLNAFVYMSVPSWAC